MPWMIHPTTTTITHSPPLSQKPEGIFVFVFWYLSVLMRLICGVEWLQDYPFTTLQPKTRGDFCFCILIFVGIDESDLWCWMTSRLSIHHPSTKNQRGYLWCCFAEAFVFELLGGNKSIFHTHCVFSIPLLKIRVELRESTASKAILQGAYRCLPPTFYRSYMFPTTRWTKVFHQRQQYRWCTDFAQEGMEQEGGPRRWEPVRYVLAYFDWFKHGTFFKWSLIITLNSVKQYSIISNVIWVGIK